MVILPVDASDPEHPKAGTPTVFLKTPGSEGEGSFSPDGRWMAYQSDESGREEVFVRPVQTTLGGKWQISVDGGAFPVWTPDGRSLFYRGPGPRIWVVDYTTANGSFTVGKPRVWSETRIESGGADHNPMTLAADGKRFAVLPSRQAADRDPGSVHVTFLLNFFDEIRRRVP